MRQKELGIDMTTGAVYERPRGQWVEVWPTPTVSMAVFFDGQNAPPPIPDISGVSSEMRIFREDGFDATTRVRRGRFYVCAGSIDTETIWPHVAPRDFTGPLSFPGATVHHFRASHQQPSAKLVAIGATDSLWRILGAERISTGEWLITLKARGALGILPEWDAEAIPELGRKPVVVALDRMVDVAHRETPGSIVDVARNTAALLMAVYAVGRETDTAKQQELLGKDLGDIVRHYEQHADLQKNVVVTSLGKIFARLHPRNKYNEQYRLGLRPMTEDDGVFAVNAIGLLLNEFAWTPQTHEFL